MQLRVAVAALLLPLALISPAHALADSSASPTPGLMDRTLQVLHLKHKPKPKQGPLIHHQFQVKMSISPSLIDLSSDREIQVTVALYNLSSKYADLDFPTSQRIEVLVRDSSGKVINTWSEDQSFTNDPASITVNPGERLEYTVNVATREMSPGQLYTLEAAFPSYPDLKAQLLVTPAK
jgi:hypothetical protein